MKKILILAYDFAPSNAIAAQRPYSWYLYFKKMGYEPVVLTRHWEKNTYTQAEAVEASKNQTIQESFSEKGWLIKVPFQPNLRDRLMLKYGLDRMIFFRKLLTLFYSIFEYLFFAFDRTAPIYKRADKLLKETSFDWIIATGSPFVLFKYAHLLSKKHNLPWVADYRDGWNTCSLKYQRGIDLFFKKIVFTPLEKKYLSNASGITTAAPIYAQQLKTLHPDKPIKVIYNGYFEEEITQYRGEETVENTSFDIAYAGTIYGYQPLEMFLEGYALFIQKEQPRETKAYFYGANYLASNQHRILNYSPKLLPYLVTTDRLSKAKLFEKLQKSAALLLLASDEEERIPAKVFEYLPLQKPILLVKDDQAILQKILTDTNNGLMCKNAADVCQHLTVLYQQFLEKKSNQFPNTNYQTYSRRHQAKQLIGFLKRMEDNKYQDVKHVK